MNENIIRFYMLANRLKNKLRTGWLEIGIEKDRIESVSEHIFGALILAISIDSEYELNLDMLKVLKMLTLHETEEILMPDFTIRSNLTSEEKLEMGRVSVYEATKGFIKQNEIEELLKEFNEHSTKESKFCYLIDKIECDFQAKLYDLEGVMDYNKTREDLNYYGDRATDIDMKSKTASDFWIEWDRPRYEENEIFKSLLNDIQSISEDEYKESINKRI